jgi:shikimate kinase
MKCAVNNVFLTGFMTAGKSTVGPILARRLGWEFSDTDEIIENETGRKISEIFSEDGEVFFRDLEARAVVGAARGRNKVVSLGGGALLRDSTRAVVLDSGIMVYLIIDAQTVVKRLSTQKKTRPIISTLSEEAIRNLMNLRESIYRLASIQVDTSPKTPAEVVACIMERLNEAKVI